jgi:hypothetical protein
LIVVTCAQRNDFIAEATARGGVETGDEYFLPCHFDVDAILKVR